MMTIQLLKIFEAPPEIVFDLLADHTKFPIWDPSFIDDGLYTGGH
jgi:uncharacterized protein YndB with AHSA1/START domain